MRKKTAHTQRAADARPWRLVLGLLLALTVSGGSPSPAQETRSTGGTLLRSEFAAKLGDAAVDWPTAEQIELARAKDTRYARHDACRWQEIILAKPFAVCSYVRGDEGERFTAGASASGYDSVYFRW